MSNTQALRLIQQIDRAGGIVLRGTAVLVALRNAITMAIERAGISIELTPESAPDLADYLVVAGSSALDGAFAGALAGLAIGALFDRPAIGMAVGAGLGTGVGVARGLTLIHNGWRICAARSWDGTPLLTVTAR